MSSFAATKLGEVVVSAGYWVKNRNSAEKIFLPAAGHAGGNGYMVDLGSQGDYWSATIYDWEWARYLQIYSGSYSTTANIRYVGRVIRAVRDANPTN